MKKVRFHLVPFCSDSADAEECGKLACGNRRRSPKSSSSSSSFSVSKEIAFSSCDNSNLVVIVVPSVMIPLLVVLVILVIKQCGLSWLERRFLHFELKIFGVKIQNFRLLPKKHESRDEILKRVISHLLPSIQNQVTVSSIQLYHNQVRVHLTESPKLKGETINMVPVGIESLDISSKNLNQLDDSDIQFYSSLKWLTLDGNHLQTIPIQFMELKALEALAIKDNNLLRLPFEMGSLTSLTILDISGNANFTKLPVSLSSLKLLRQISISGTAIKQIHSVFLYFSQNGGSFNIGQSPKNFPPLEDPPLDTFIAPQDCLKKEETIRNALIVYWQDLKARRQAMIPYTIPAVVLGKSGAGKTTFTKSLVKGSPTHAITSSIGFEEPMELKVDNPINMSKPLSLRILDVAGRECYGILHSFLLSVGNPRNLISVIVVNAAEYYRILLCNIAPGGNLNIQLHYMKHFGVWLNAALCINPYSIIHVILSHTDVMGKEGVVLVKNGLRDRMDQQLEERIEHHSEKPHLQAQASHLSHLNESIEFIELACFQPDHGIASSHHLQFSQGLNKVKDLLAVAAGELNATLEFKYLDYWHPAIEYIFKCADQESRTMLSKADMVALFPDLSYEMDHILFFLSRRRIIFPFPHSDYFCPSSYHLQAVCKLAVDHTSENELLEEVPNLSLTGNVPVSILKSIWSRSLRSDANPFIQTTGQNPDNGQRRKQMMKWMLAVVSIVGVIIAISVCSSITYTGNNATKGPVEVDDMNITYTGNNATNGAVEEDDVSITTVPNEASTVTDSPQKSEMPLAQILGIGISIGIFMCIPCIAYLFIIRSPVSFLGRMRRLRKNDDQPAEGDDDFSMVPLIEIPSTPSISLEEWFNLLKNMLIKHFLCYEVLILTETGEMTESLHLPFLLRKVAPQSECLFHWPLIQPDVQMAMEFAFFPVIPFGMLSSLLNILRTETPNFFQAWQIDMTCDWQGGTIMTLSAPTERDLKILVQGINYSFNPDDWFNPVIGYPVNSGPYSIPHDLHEPKIYIMIRGSKGHKTNMWKWLIFAKESLSRLTSNNWPGCYYEVYLPCPQAIGQRNIRDFDHGLEPLISRQHEPILECDNCAQVQD